MNMENKFGAVIDKINEIVFSLKFSHSPDSIKDLKLGKFRRIRRSAWTLNPDTLQWYIRTDGYGASELLDMSEFYEIELTESAKIALEVLRDKMAVGRICYFADGNAYWFDFRFKETVIDSVKSLGARWDNDLKGWYLHATPQNTRQLRKCLTEKNPWNPWLLTQEAQERLYGLP